MKLGKKKKKKKKKEEKKKKEGYSSLIEVKIVANPPLHLDRWPILFFNPPPPPPPSLITETE
jgi:hypothetical protein